MTPTGPAWVLCSICGKRPATLDVPIKPTSGRKYGEVTRIETWCVPCRDEVFRGGQETAWFQTGVGWLPKDRIPRTPR